MIACSTCPEECTWFEECKCQDEAKMMSVEFRIGDNMMEKLGGNEVTLKGDEYNYNGMMASMKEMSIKGTLHSGDEECPGKPVVGGEFPGTDGMVKGTTGRGEEVDK